MIESITVVTREPHSMELMERWNQTLGNWLKTPVYAHINCNGYDLHVSTLSSVNFQETSFAKFAVRCQSLPTLMNLTWSPEKNTRSGATFSLVGCRTEIVTFTVTCINLPLKSLALHSHRSPMYTFCRIFAGNLENCMGTLHRHNHNRTKC